VLWELFGAKAPAVALRVFANRTVWASSAIYFAVAGSFFAILFIQPLWSQASLGFTTTLTGLLLMTRAGVLALLFPLTAWVTSQERWDMRWFAAGGIFLAGLASWLQTLVMTTQTPFASLIATQALGGVGYAFIFVPLSVVLFKTVPPPSIPAALALTRLIQQMGASFGSALAATFLDRNYATALNALAPSASLGTPAVASFLAGHGPNALSTLNALVEAQATNLSAVTTTQFFALITMAAAVLPFLLARNRTTVAPPAAQVPAQPSEQPIAILRGSVEPPRTLVLR
jgi:MFS transporter, DHA2 family, multidrug resistance protein